MLSQVDWVVTEGWTMGMALRSVVRAESAALGQERPVLHGTNLPSQCFLLREAAKKCSRQWEIFGGD